MRPPLGRHLRLFPFDLCPSHRGLYVLADNGRWVCPAHPCGWWVEVVSSPGQRVEWVVHAELTPALELPPLPPPTLGDKYGLGGQVIAL